MIQIDVRVALFNVLYYKFSKNPPLHFAKGVPKRSPSRNEAHLE